MREKKYLMPPAECASIKDYEKSSYWKHKSSELLKNVDLVCPVCHRPMYTWQTRKKQFKKKLRFCVHHINYSNVPYEKPEDFIILCSTCHTFCHKVLQLKNIGPFYTEIANFVEKYFRYEKNTFKKDIYEKNRGTKSEAVY